MIFAKLRYFFAISTSLYTGFPPYPQKVNIHRAEQLH